MPLTILPGIIQLARLPCCIDFERAEHGDVDVPAAHHRKRIGAAEIRRARQLGDGFLAGVDQVGIDLRLGGIRPDAEHAVLGMQRDLDAGRQAVRDQRRHADAEVDVVAVAQVARDAANDAIALIHCAVVRFLDPLLVRRPLDQSLHEDARRVHAVRLDRAGVDQLLDFGDRVSRRGRHHRIEVARGLSIHEVAGAIALPRLDEREVGVQRRLEDVGAAVDDAALLAFRDQRAGAGRREETADAGARRAHPLGERALRHQLDFDLLLQELPLEFLVLADVGRDHLAHLPRAQQRPDAVVVDAGVVADDGQVLGAAAMQRGDQVFGNAAQPEAAHHDGGAIGNDGDRLVGGGQHFVHT